MYTRCPSCSATFRVTATILQMAEGDVRCGACGVVFNALQTLVDDWTATNLPVAGALGPVEPDEPAADVEPPGQPAAVPRHPGGEVNLEFDVPENEWQRFFITPQPAARPARTEPALGAGFETLEPTPSPAPGVAGDLTDAPAAPRSIEEETADTDTWQGFLREAGALGPLADPAPGPAPAPADAARGPDLGDLADSPADDMADDRADDLTDAALDDLIDDVADDLDEDEESADPLFRVGEEETPGTGVFVRRTATADADPPWSMAPGGALEGPWGGDADDATLPPVPALEPPPLVLPEDPVPALGPVDADEPEALAPWEEAPRDEPAADPLPEHEPREEYPSEDPASGDAGYTDEADGPPARAGDHDPAIPAGLAAAALADADGDRGAGPGTVLDWGPAPGFPEREPAPPRHTVRWLAASLAAALALAGQLVHQSRDALAADPAWGSTTRAVYARLGRPLNPAWPLDAYEIRGAKAIAENSAPGALDIVAEIAVNGAQPVGAPVVRVVLRDRWSNTVATGTFEPDTYLAEPPPPGGVYPPGSLIPVAISLADPGTAAQGYELDVCMPNRQLGLQCKNTRDPFRR